MFVCTAKFLLPKIPDEPSGKAGASGLLLMDINTIRSDLYSLCWPVNWPWILSLR